MDSCVHDGDREVVERGTEMLADCVHLVQWQGQGCDRPGHLQWCIHRPALRRERRAADRVGTQQQREPLLECTERHVPEGEGLSGRGEAKFGEAIHQRLGRAGLAHGQFGGERRRLDGLAGTRTQARVETLRSGHAVDDRVVHLGIDGKQVVRDAVDDPVAEQRPVAVEQRLVQVGHQSQQVVVRRSLRQREVLVVVTGVVRLRLEEAGHAGADDLGKVIERRRRFVRPVRLDDFPDDPGAALRFLKQQQCADVRRARLRFHDQPHQVEWRDRPGHVSLYLLRM